MRSARAALEEHGFDTPDELAAALADALAQRLRNAIIARGRATLIASGGTTPQTTYAQLACKSIDWNDVTMSLADERWVPPYDPASNEAMLRRALLVGAAASARFVGLYTGDPSPEAGEQACAARLQTLARPFDVVLLGMGDDGHTASLFPGATGLHSALDPAGAALCKAIRAPAIEPPRMSLTLRALLDARAVFLLFQGESKRRTYEAALADGPVEAMPVRAVLRQHQVPVEVYWSRAA